MRIIDHTKPAAMKTTVHTVIIFLLCMPLARAQNWSLIPSDKPLFFKNEDGKVMTVHLRYSDKTGVDSTLYFYAGALETDKDNRSLEWKYKPQGDSTYIFYEPTIIGGEIGIRSNGIHLLRNKNEGTSIQIKTWAQPNTSWQYDSITSHIATVDRLYFGSLDGIADSFKEISLKTDKHTLNMVLSKNHGLMATSNLFTAGNEKAKEYTRTGDPRFTFRQVNNLHVGDIFHSTYSYDALYGGKYIDTVLKKVVSPDSTKVTYTVKRLRERNSYFPELTTLHHETVTWEFNYENKLVVEGYPGILYPNPGGPSSFSFFTCYDSSSAYKTGFIKNFQEISWSPFNRSYYAGAGAYYYSSPESENGVTHHSLSYFKKGTKEWGQFLIIGMPNIPEPDEIRIFPCPAQDRIFLKGIANHTHVSIMDMNGKNILQTQVGNGFVNTQDLSNGIYTIKLEGGGHSRFIISR